MLGVDNMLLYLSVIDINYQVMTEREVKEIIHNLPIGAKLQVIKTNGDIIEVSLASNEVNSIEAKNYSDLNVPAMPPAIEVQGGRWGAYRLEISEIVNIARVG